MGKKCDKGCKGGDDCGDGNHLCRIAKHHDMDRVRNLIKDARFFCTKCGRSAHEEIHLRKPLRI